MAHRGSICARSYALCAVASLLLAAAPDTSSAASPKPLWLRLEVVENSAEGPASRRCGIAAILDGKSVARWRVFYGEVREGTAGQWSAIRARAGCGPVSSESDPGPWSLRGSPYLLAHIELIRRPGPDSPMVLEASLALRKLTFFTPEGEPRYERTTARRIIHPREGDSDVFPLLFATARERGEFGLRELLLRLRVVELGALPGAEFGEIAVSADLPGAAVLLDGGQVARIPSRGVAILPRVPTGERRVALRDVSGRTTATVARVARGQRSEVSLRLLPEANDGAPLLALGRNREGAAEFWRAKDGAIVVRIRAGEVQMGSPVGQGEAAEQPRHVVRVGGFLLDKTEVTWGPYRRFADETGRRLGKVPIWGTPEELPASAVTWEDGRAFCAWAGGRLPTEAEWERAGRGDDTRRYPWGEEWDASRCNTRDGGPHALTAAGSLPECTSPFGVLDLAGNVWEWCSDWFAADYYAVSPAENPKGPASGTTRVSRGGCFMSPSFAARTASRQGTDPEWADTLRGFRCAMDEAGPDDGAAETSPSPPRRNAERGVLVTLETSYTPEAGPRQRCEVARHTGLEPLVAWSAFGGARAGADGRVEVAPGGSCGPGPFPAPPPAAAVQGEVPFLILAVSATPMLDAGAMDPGPAQVTQLATTVTVRRLTRFSPEGTPVYGEGAPDHRLARMTADDEFVVPVPVGPRARAALGGEVLVRFRAARHVEAGAAEYGTVLVIDALPDAKILVDGGAAAAAGAGARAVLTAIRAGVHVVTLGVAPGRTVDRVVDVIAGRTVVASAGAEQGGPFLEPAGRNTLGLSSFRRRRDDAVMIRIPAGEFVMGNLETEGGPLPHPVHLSAFLMDELPVTWGRFQRFAAATGTALPPAPYWGIHDDHPVVYVSWDEARAYCEWAGARLPTEAEREKAARGTDGRLYPWGDEEPSPERGVFRRDWGYEATDPVGRRPAGASPYGILDAGGNVWEWCEDWYDADYYAVSPRRDPTGPRTGRARVVRGGSWDSRPTVLSASCRNYGYIGYREGDFGFRCAAEPPRPGNR